MDQKDHASENASEDARKDAQAGIRAWIARTGRTLQRKAPAAVVTGMTAAALAPILVPELAGAAGPYAVQKLLAQLGGAGAGYLAATAHETTAKLRGQVKAGDDAEVAIRDLLDDKLGRELAGPHAVQVGTEIAMFVHAIGGVDETVRAAYASDVPGLGDHIVNAMQSLSLAVTEFRALGHDVLGALDSIQGDTAYLRTAVRDQGDELRRLSISIALLRRRLARGAAADPELTWKEPPALDDGVCPYPGLAPFSEDYEAWFYGRDRLIAELLSRLGQRLFGPAPLIVMGASGAGKSSLLWAGLIPELSDGGLAVPNSTGPNSTGPDSDGPGSRDWPLKAMTPGRFPLRDLAVLLADLARIRSPQVYEQLAADPASTPLLIRQGLLTRDERRRRGGAGELTEAVRGRRLVLVIDQFEEVFTRCRDGEERRQFIDALCAATRGSLHDPPPALVVAGIRAAFVESCTAHPGLAPALADPLTVGPMSPQELREAIEEPAGQVGLAVEDGLAATMLRDLGAVEPAGEDIATYDPGRLPLLAHALRETWARRRDSRLTVAAYEAAGGIANALAATADSLYTGLDAPGQRVARRLLLRMVATHGDAEDTRRRMSRRALLAEFPEADAEIADRLLDHLERQRLVTADADTVQIAHEALLRYWPRLAGWLAEDREWRREQQRLADHAHEWDDAGRHPDMLLPGTALAAVHDKLGTSRRAELGELEEAFLRASERKHAHLHRTRTVLMAVLAALGLLAAGLAVAAQHSSVLARHSSELAGQQKALAQSRQLAANAVALRPSDPEIALLLSLEAYRVAPSYEAVSGLLSAQSGLFARSLADPAGPVHGVAFNHDGTLLAAAGHGNTVSLWDTASHQLIATLPGRSPFYAVAFDPAGSLLAGAEQDGTTVLWNAETRQQVGILGSMTGLGVNAVAFDPRGRVVATAGDSGVTLWDMRTLRRIASPMVGHATVNGIAFSPDGTSLAAACSDHEVRVWKLARPAAGPLVLSGHTDPVQAVAFRPGPGGLLASGGDDGTIRLWDTKAGTQRDVLSGSSRAVDALAFSPDGTQLASGGADDAVRLWDVATLTQAGVLTGPANTVTGVAFGPGGHTLAGGGVDGTVDLWDVAAAPRPGVKAAAVAVSGPGGALATAVEGGKVAVWDPRQPGGPGGSSLPLPVPPGSAGGAAALGARPPGMALSPDGRILAVAPPGDKVTLWDTHTGHEARKLRPAPSPLTAVAYRPVAGPAVVAAGSSDGYVYLWGPGNSPPIPLGGVFQAAVESVAFSPDGRLLAAGDGDGNFALAQVRVVGNQVRPQPLSPAGGQLNPVDAVAFSPDGRVLATGSADGTVELWDISDASRRVRLATLTGLTQAVTSLAFSPGTSPGGGAELAVSADDGTIHLWDVSHPAAPVALATLTGLGNPTAISWEDDGLASRTVVGAAPDGTVVSWDTKPRAIAARICASPLAGSGSDLGPYLGGSIAYRAICPPG